MKGERVGWNIFMFFFLSLTALCTSSGKHALSKHNQKALETDYSSVTFGHEELSQLQNMLCVIVPNQQNMYGAAEYHVKRVSPASGLILCMALGHGWTVNVNEDNLTHKHSGNGSGLKSSYVSLCKAVCTFFLSSIHV